MIDCKNSHKLFANFQREYKTDDITEVEKLMGIDPNKPRSKGILKKLAILRREVLLHNHRDEVLRWPTVVKKIEDV